MQTTRAWLVVGPAVIAGVLAGHELAYSVTGTREGPTHDYLAHMPQVLLILVVLGLVTARIGARIRLPPVWQLPVVAVATFVVQEHVERLVHTGGVPFILTTPVFLVGVVLQLPIAALAWLLTRSVLEALAVPGRAGPAGVSRFVVRVVAPVSVTLPLTIGAPLPGRGPPPAPRP